MLKQIFSPCVRKMVEYLSDYTAGQLEGNACKFNLENNRERIALTNEHEQSYPKACICRMQQIANLPSPSELTLTMLYL